MRTEPEEKKRVDDKTLRQMLRTMLICRKFDEKCVEFFQMGKQVLPGFVHTAIGMEAIAAGACAPLRKDDYVVVTHRGYNHLIARGASLNRLMAEICGRATGICKGRAGWLVEDLSVGALDMGGVLGFHYGLADGAGLTFKLRGTDQVVVCFFGDGVANRGTFHSGLNLAALWKLPIVFVCENNEYSVSLHISKAIPVKNIADRAPGYGIPGLVVDGNDCVAVFEAVNEAVTRARQGNGPSLIECKSFLWRAHTEGFYPYEGVEEWKAKDPIKRMKTRLLELGVMKEQEIAELESRANNEVEAAARFAMESPFPKPEEALEGLYA